MKSATNKEPPAKLRLLEAAIEEFADHGYDAATVRDICGRAGTNVNAVKYYYEDKHGLYLEALRHAHAEVHSELTPPLDQQGLPQDRLRHFITNMMHTLLSRQGRDTRHLLLVRELLSPTDGTDAIVNLFIKPRFEMLCGVLSEIAPHLEPPKIRLIGYSVIGQCMHYKMAMPVVRLLTPADEASSYTHEHLAGHIYSMTMASLAQPR